jgi:selenocysteine lyase/cysteine desulfurase
MSASSVDALTRASFYFYNNKDDVDKLILGLEKVIEVFSK